MPGFPVLHYLPDLFRLMSIESMMPSNHLILSFTSASVLPVKSQDLFPLGLTGLICLQAKGLSGVFSNTVVWKHQFFGSQPSLWSNSHLCMTTGKTIAWYDCIQKHQTEQSNLEEKRREVTKESLCGTPFKRSSARAGNGDLIHDFKCNLQVKLKNVVRIYL